MTKLAIITGASSGIGAACARQFREQGFTVINVSRRECPVDGVVNICGDLGEVTSANALGQRLVEAIEQHTPTSVCVVHNAALMLKDSVTDTTDSDLERVMQINVVAINALNRHLLPLLPTSSSLLFIGSTLSEKAVAGAFSYVVSKHAQLGMMRATCQDLMGKGIHTALIGPGFTDTEMLRGHVGHNQEIIAAISELNSFGRLVDPQEIASLVTWCHDNPVINGSVLHANLGQVEN
jgi:NAD(P)-dependent dehydrogenase (short-subunit alcohol dehydrogenase family)